MRTEEIETCKILERALRLACVSLIEFGFLGACPNNTYKAVLDCENCKQNYLECWEKYFKRQAISDVGEGDVIEISGT